MAKKLNKKVVVIGIVLLVGLGMLIAAVAVNELWRKNPARFISRAEGKVAAGDYEGAARDYYAAFSRSKKKEQQIEMLETTVEMFKKAGAWDKVVGSWNKMATVDPSNWEARKNIIGYYKQRADSGEIRIWPGIESSVDELIESQLDADVEIDPELYYLKGKALYFSATMGGTLDKKETAEQAIENLEKAIELYGDDVNVDAYWYMALSVLAKGQVQEESGLLGAEENARANAKSILEQCSAKVPDDPNSALYLVNISVGKTRDEILEAEEKFLALAKRFNEPVIYNALASYYDRLGMKLKALDASVKSLELNASEINAVIKTATLYYAAYNINGNEEDKDAAISLATNALDMPGTQDEPSYITQAANRNRKLIVYNLLAEIYLSAAFEIENVDDRQEVIELAAEQVHKIKQMVASDESAISYRLDGLLNLAKGNDSLAVKQMYTAYQKYVAAKQSGEFMSYMLAKSFASTSETGAVVEFLGNALTSPNYLASHPSQLLEYVNIFVTLNPATAVNVLDRYEEVFGVDEASKLARLRVYIRMGQSESARELMDGYADDNPDKILAQAALLANDSKQNFGTIMQLRAKIENGDQSAIPVLEQIEAENSQLQDKQVGLIYGLLERSPKSVDSRNFTSVVNYYIENEKFDEATQASKLYLKENPEDLSAKIFVKLLGEPNPADVTAERREELAIEAIGSIADSLKRAMALARYNQTSQKFEEAIKYYRQAIDVEAGNREAVAGLFEIAIAQKNIELIDELVAKAVEYDYDDCQGEFYQARAEMIKENYEQALKLLDSCQEKRPVYSILYLLRSRVYNQLGQYDEALEDIHVAAKYNPLNGEFSRTLAVMLYQRNLRLGDNTTQDELTEAKTALQSAMQMNPNDAGLQSIYAEYLSHNDPERVLAMLQAMQKQEPSVDNAIRIGVTAMKIATRQNPPIVPTVKGAMLEIAESSIKQALELEPGSDAATRIYVNLLQIKGELDKAEELIKDNENLLWKFYLQNGKYEKAKDILLQIYDGGDKTNETLIGLLTVSQRLKDARGVELYSTALVEGSPDDIEIRLLQIRTYLEVDMLDKAQDKLASLIARYPDEPRAYLLKAFADTRNSKLEDALEAVNQALRNDPEDAKAWRLKGEINYLQANFNDAIDDLKKSKSINPEPEVRIALAKAYLQTNQTNNAKTELKIATQDPQSPVVAWLLLEDLYLKANMSNDITKFYARALERSGGNPDWLNKYANYCFAQKQFAKAGELYLQSWKKSQPQGSVEAMQGYIKVLSEEKKYSAVIRFLLKHIDGNYATLAYVGIGEAKYNLDDKESAKESFVKALEKAGENYQIVGNVSVKIAEVIGLDQGIALIKSELGSESIFVDFAQYNIYASRGNYDKALGYIESCMAASSNEQDIAVFNSLRLRLLQTLYTQTKSSKYLSELISEYEKMLAENPDNIMVLNNAAYLIAESGLDIEKAKSYAQRAYRKIPNNPGIMDTYAFVLLQEGNNEEALELLIKAKQLFEKQSAYGPSDFYEHLGLANKKLDNIDMAIAAYELALEAGKAIMPESDVKRIESLIIDLESNR